MVERGLDTLKIPPSINMPATLQETQFIVEMDHRLGSIVSDSAEDIPVSFIDDDQIASYYVSENTLDVGTPVVVGRAGSAVSVDSYLNHATGDNSAPISIHHIRGPRDRIIHFKVEPNINLRTSTFLFDKLGGSSTIVLNGIDGFKAGTYLYIDSLVRLTSATTAYSIDIPVRYIKKST
jgi:hypothetical protein